MSFSLVTPVSVILLPLVLGGATHLVGDGSQPSSLPYAHAVAGGRADLSALRLPPSSPDTLSLAGALRLALDHHPSLGAARQRVREAEADTRGARADRLPSLSFQGEMTRFQLPMVVAPLHAFDPTTPPEFDDTLVRSRLGGSWLVFDGGGSRAAVDAHRAARNVSRARLETTEIELLRRTTTAYLRVVTARLVLEAAGERIEAMEAEGERVDRFLEEGRAARVEQPRAEAGLREAEADAASARAEVRTAEGLLARLTGLKPTDLSRLELPLPDVAIPDPPVDEFVPPALVAAREGVESARARTRVARASRFPRIELTGGLSQFGGASSSTTTEWDGGLRVSWSLFTAGQRGEEEEAANARLARAREDLRAVELDLEDQVTAARAALEAARSRREALRAAVTAHAEVARIEVLALETGTGVQRELLEAEASLFQSRAALAGAEAEVITTRLRLAEALGELRRDWLLETLEIRP